MRKQKNADITDTFRPIVLLQDASGLLEVTHLGLERASYIQVADPACRVMGALILASCDNCSIQHAIELADRRIPFHLFVDADISRNGIWSVQLLQLN